jgi:Na+/H+-dicarboxylate symporter
MQVFKKIFGISQQKQILLGLAFGVIIGLIFRQNLAVLGSVKILGDIFLKMLKMTIAPLIFVSIAHIFCSMQNGSQLGRVAFKAIVIFKVMTLVTAVFGIFIAILLKIGVGVFVSPESLGITNFAKIKPSELDTSQMILHIFPENFFKSLVEGDILQILVFACFFGIATKRISHQVSTVVSLVESMYHIVFEIITIVIKFTPIGMFGIVAYLVGTQEFNALKSLVYLVATVYGCGFFVAYVLYGLVLIIYGLNPIPFFKKIAQSQFFAFLTSSSAATVPIAKVVAEKKLGVSQSTSSLVIPLGSALNLSGTTLHFGITSIFLANIFGADLSMIQYVQIVALSIMLTMGAAGIPSASLVMMPVILSAIGVPPEYVAFYVGVDRFLDMVRSMLNSTGDVLTAVIVDKSEGTLNREIYNGKSVK